MLKTFTIRLSRGLITPNSLKTSESFQVWITDLNGFEINFQRNSLALTMKEAKPMDDVLLEVSSETVGAWNRHIVYFNAPVPLSNDFIAYIFVPEECELPSMAQTLARSMLETQEDQSPITPNDDDPNQFNCIGS